MAIQTRGSRMAIVAEVTEAVPVAPTSATQYIALQDGFSVSGSFETLENNELKASIGQSKPILGFEGGEAEVSHYLKHSGVEGQEPNYGLLFESAFGAKSVASVEYDTVAASTAGTESAAAVVKVNTGEGATYERGEMLLIKDSANGYSIRPIKSISGDDLTLAFNLAAAPSSGINLGKCVLYKPANSAHKTLSLWDYRGNGGAVQLLAGARVTEVGVEVNAGELINSTFSMEGVGFYFDPIEITSSTRYIDWTDDDGTHAVAVAVKMYKDPHELAAALQSAIDGQTTETITVTYNDANGKFTIATSTSAVLSILWNTGANTANTIATKIGFSAAADSTGALTYTSANALTLTSPQTPSVDATDPIAAKNLEVMMGGFADTACFGAQSVTFTLSDTKQDVLDICAESGKSGSIITGREVSIEVVATLSAYDADKFRRFRENEETQIQVSFGTKSGGNWVAGKCGALYLATGVISEFSLDDSDGLVVLNMTVNAYVDSNGNGEFYLGFV